jgi:hypothetical protein
MKDDIWAEERWTEWWEKSKIEERHGLCLLDLHSRGEGGGGAVFKIWDAVEGKELMWDINA